jgi:hypothetical protein
VKPDNLPKYGLNLLPFAEHVFAEVRAFFAFNGIALPERQYICPGLPSLDAWDCEQFAVGCVGIIDANPQQGSISSAARGGSPFSSQKMRAVVYGIQIVRACAPTMSARGNPPSPATVDAAGRMQLKDMGCLSQIVVNLCSSLPEWIPQGVNADAGQCVPLGPEGRFTAIEASITLNAIELLPPPDPDVL